METLDQNENQNSFPEEALQSIRSMYGWVMFSGVCGIIFGILLIIASLIGLSQTPKESFFNLIIYTLVAVASFVIIQSASSLNKFKMTNNPEDISKAMRLNGRYWMMYSIILFLFIIFSILNAQIR